MRTLLAPLAVAGLLAGTAQAREFEAGPIAVEDPWARSAAAGNGAVYFELANHGPAPDRLVGVASPAAGTAELHASVVDAQGVATMRPVQAIDLPAGGRAKLAPSGLHVMLIGLKGPLREGMRLPMTLVFERAGEVAVEFEVVGKSGPAPDAGMEHDGHGAGDEP